MAQFASDTFTGTSGTELSAYNSAWTLHTSTGSGSVIISDTGTRAHRNTGNTTVYWHSGTPASADYTVNADYFAKSANGAGSEGVCGRHSTSALTCYIADYIGGGVNTFRLRKIVSGSITSLGSSGDTWTDETSRNIKLEMIGSAIAMYVDGSGTALLSATDSAITAAGQAAIRGGSTTASNTAGLHIDNFSADDVVSGVSGTSATTNAADTSSASGTTTVTGTSARTNANDTSSASGTTTVLGASATTNAADTSSASGTVGNGEVTGTSATTNAADTSSASGTTTVVGTVATTNANDTAAASGWAGLVSGTSATTNANDTSSAQGQTTTTRRVGAGSPKKHRRVVEIDGEDFVVNSTDEAIALLDRAKEEAEQIAREAVRRAVAAPKRRPSKVLADARNALVVPSIEAPEIQAYANGVIEHIRNLYESAMLTIEIATLQAKRERQEEDDEEVLLLLV